MRSVRLRSCWRKKTCTYAETWVRIPRQIKLGNNSRKLWWFGIRSFDPKRNLFVLSSSTNKKRSFKTLFENLKPVFFRGRKFNKIFINIFWRFCTIRNLTPRSKEVVLNLKLFYKRKVLNRYCGARNHFQNYERTQVRMSRWIHKWFIFCKFWEGQDTDGRIKVFLVSQSKRLIKFWNFRMNTWKEKSNL